MRLHHFTADPFTLDPARTYHQAPDHKPRGLWMSVPDEYGWDDWCTAEDCGDETLAHRTTIDVDMSNILHLDSVSDLEWFTDHFSAHQYDGDASIDWPRVAANYDGILISPYQWGARLAPTIRWYYGWDCASACIWNLNAITIGVDA